MAVLSTIAAFGFEAFNPPTLLKLYRQLGCRSCQFYRNVDNPPDPDQARKLADDLGLPIDSVHGVFGPDLDLSSLDDATRQQAVATYRAEGVLAQRLGGPMVVTHPAPRAQDPAAITDESRARRVDPLRRSMQELARIGGELGVTFLIENIPADYYLGSDPAQLAQMIRESDSPWLRMCFDVGHAHMTAQPAEALDACSDVVAYVHVHDNNGRSDDHLIPGQGNADWAALPGPMGRLGAGVYAMLELFVTEEALVEQIEGGLAARLRQWLALND